ncbi:LysR family transcriptional regulator [Streptomyces xantholiticus]
MPHRGTHRRRRRRHFGRAARRLQMSQPPLSQAIKQLEQQLGCELLHRTQRSVALSPAGAVFLDHCRALIRHAEEAETAARQAATGRGGRLSLGAVASAFSWPLPLVLERFHEAVPDVEIRTQEIDTHEAAAGLLDRSLDWAIVRQTTPVRGTTATALFVDRFVAALPLRHSAAEAAGPLDLADVAGAPWVCGYGCTAISRPTTTTPWRPCAEPPASAPSRPTGHGR